MSHNATAAVQFCHDVAVYYCYAGSSWMSPVADEAHALLRTCSASRLQLVATQAAGSAKQAAARSRCRGISSCACVLHVACAGYGLHTGHAILMRSNASKWPGGSTLFSLALLRSLSSGQWSPGEQQELLARRVQLLRYLLRSPCYNAFTR